MANGSFSKTTRLFSEETARTKYREIWNILRSGDGWVQLNDNHDGRFFLTMNAVSERKSEITRVLES